MEQWDTSVNTQHPINSVEKLPNQWDIYHSKSAYRDFTVITILVLAIVVYGLYQKAKLDFIAIGFIIFLGYWLRKFIRTSRDKRSQVSITDSSITSISEGSFSWDKVTRTMISQSVKDKVSRHYLLVETCEMREGKETLLTYSIDLNHMDKSVGEIEHFVELYKLKHKQNVSMQ